MQQVLRENGAVTPSERCLVRIKHALQNLHEACIGDPEIEEQLHDPALRADVALVLKRVFLEHWNENGDGERSVGQAESLAHPSDLLYDFLPGVGHFGGNSGFVRLFQEALPCGTDIGGVAVVGGLVDEKTDVEVACLVCVVIVELKQESVSKPQLRGMLFYKGKSSHRSILLSFRLVVERSQAFVLVRDVDRLVAFVVSHPVYWPHREALQPRA